MYLTILVSELPVIPVLGQQRIHARSEMRVEGETLVNLPVAELADTLLKDLWMVCKDNIITSMHSQASAGVLPADVASKDVL